MSHFLDQRRQAANTSGTPPCGTGRSQPFDAELRATPVERNGRQLVQLDGYASVVEAGYEMFDMFGPYTEVVDASAFDKTLAADPDVAFLLNHRGMTMARTTNDTLELSADDTGLKSSAFVNPERTDVKDLVSAVDDGLITEMSFAFWINRGSWSPDYTEFRILEVDIDRGDVSAVNYGANPDTTIMARQRELFTMLDGLEGAALRAARERLASRDKTPEPSGRGLSLLRAQVDTGRA